MIIKPLSLILIRAAILEWIEDFLVKVMTFGKQTGWSGVENDYQAFYTNQCNNLGLWIEYSLITVSISGRLCYYTS